MFDRGGAQYVKPQTPYVPDYIKAKYPQGVPPQPQEPEQPLRQEDYVRRQTPYVVVSEKNTEPKPAMKRRTLIVLIAVAAVVLVGVWISQLIFSSQTQSVFAARAAAEERNADKHPSASGN